MHIQGVDTVNIPDDLLRRHQTPVGHAHATTVGLSSIPSMSLSGFEAGLRFFHKVCPASYYQDDYLVALLFNIADVAVRSTWNTHHVAHHVEGVSKNHAQMHMSSKVHAREEETKACIVKYADLLIEHLLDLRAVTRAQGEL